MDLNFENKREMILSSTFKTALKTISMSVLMLCSIAVIKAEERFALVIGNGDYQAVESLKNARNDAQLIAASFKAVGFETELLTDLSEENMSEALARLAKRAGSLDVVALYYAGHAIQKEGQNFLIPIDAQIKSETAIDSETVALQAFMKVLERVPISLMFLDACRNNPFAENISKKKFTTDSCHHYSARTGGSAAGWRYAHHICDLAQCCCI